MRILLSIMTLCFCVCLSLETRADYSYHSTNLVNQIKPNPIVRSKPTSSLKLASVQFLTDTNNVSLKNIELDVKTRCQMAGYYKKITDCTASGEAYGARCSDDTNIYFEASERSEADNYVAGCCSKIYSVLNPKDCSDNSYASGNSCLLGKGQQNGGKWVYECICNRSSYPYGSDAPCISGESFDEKDVCKSISKEDGTVKTYYKSCCRVSGSGAYIQCDSNNHEEGSGNYCIVNGNILYQRCSCNSNYDFRKSDCNTFLLDGCDICRQGSIDYIREENCYRVCSDTRYQDLERFYKNEGLERLYSIMNNLGIMEE